MIQKLFSKTCAAALVVASVTTAEAADLVLYTSQPTAQMESVLELFNEQHPDISVDVYRSGTTEVLNKLQAEIAGGNPQPDVLLIADSVAMEQLKAQDVLQPYPEADVSALPAGQYDPEGYWFGTKMITTGIIYNTRMDVPKPTSWQDLLAPAAENQVIMPSPLYSGAALAHVGTVTQQQGMGWDYYEALAANGAIAGKGNGSVRDAVSRGEKAYGIIIDYMAFGQKLKGSPVDFVFPEEGVSVINQPVAILASAKNVEAAKAFVDFQLSQQASEHAVTQNYFPIRAGISAPEGYPDPASLKIMPLDASELMQSTDDLKRTFAELFGG
ncbi:ABC transporter substrate-binding protein [Pseudovibrio exalbescens]|uniref:ABC transporter substrate-binding protein n=1 Tax=Pseudovibrio exalbescens TaxID=197461 RepID=UPI0023655DDB|nr:ABC transporter substrate-binding protein [Pseudovibrio exalbescens]MDD7910584.1 ABC transporter substrate-binding protein [Pseudovibrio exalbescens]